MVITPTTAWAPARSAISVMSHGCDTAAAPTTTFSTPKSKSASASSARDATAHSQWDERFGCQARDRAKVRRVALTTRVDIDHHEFTHL